MMKTAVPSANGQGASRLTNGPTLPQTAPENRDPTGRWLRGCPPGPGNPFVRAVGARRKAILEAVTAEDVAAVARKLRDQALAGDVAAAKVLLAYVVGKPAPAADPDRADLQEVRLLLEAPLAEQLLTSAVGAVAADVAAEWLRLAHTVRGDRALQPDPEEDDDDGPAAIARAAALWQLRDQILQARARAT
jgi:hypothetical protein